MPTVFFDYDGTLHDTIRVYAPAFRTGYAQLVEQGLAKPREFTDEWIAGWLGWTVADMWHAFLPELTEEQWRPISRLIGKEMFRLIDEGHAGFYDGIEEALDQLKVDGYRLVLLSNSQHAYCNRHREVFGLDRWFCDYVIAGDYPGMEKWEYFQKALPCFDGPYAVVGDRFHDIDAAVRAGVPSVGCGYGCARPGELDQASVVVESPRQIPDAVKRLIG